jgi:hypothetical protein
MSESNFDPALFLDATTTEAATRRPPLPVGDYIGTIGEPKSRAWESKKPDAKVKSGIAVDVPIEVDVQSYLPTFSSENQKIFKDVQKVQLNASIMLDLNDGGMIDWGVGRNGALRRWREALDMNKPGEAFSIRMMSGRQVKIKVKHRVYEGEFFDEIDSVAKP